MEKILIGSGYLSWIRNERISDRYGTVFLYDNGVENIITREYVDSKNLMEFSGVVGDLICEVIETKKSPHMGDFFHGFYPETPNIGDNITIGKSGHFFIDQPDKTLNFYCVGLNSYRKSFWLNPQELYKVIDQKINIYFTYGNTKTTQ